MRSSPWGFLCSTVMLALLLASCGADKRIVNLLDPPAARNRPVAVMRVNVIENGDWGDIYILADASASYDLDEKTLTYLWELVEIPIGSSAALTTPAAMITQFQADFSGCYTLTLVVTNSSGVLSVPAKQRLRVVGAGGGGWVPRPNECSL